MRPSNRLALVVALSLVTSSLTVPAAAVAARGDGDAAVDESTGPPKRIAVLPISVDDEIDAAARDELLAQLRVGLGRGEVELLDDDVVAAAASGCAEGCSAEQLASLRAEHGATHFLRTRVDKQSRDYTVELEIVELESGRVAIESNQICEICGLQEVGEQLESQGAAAQARLAALDDVVRVSSVLIESEPSGALVFIDGALVGNTPYEGDLTQGPHSARVSLNGYIGDEREFELGDGDREELRFTLKQALASPRLRAVGGALLGTGLALFAGGAVLIGFDGEDFRPRCSGEDVDADGDCRFVLDTKWGGAGLLAGGAIMATVGAMFLIRYRKNNKKSDKRSDKSGKKSGTSERAARPGVTDLGLGFRPGGVMLRGRF